VTFTDACLALEIKQVCFGGCGLSEYRHRLGIIDPFGVIHWRERRMSRRALRNFLLLVAKRDRLANPEFLNLPDVDWSHPYFDNIEVGRLAARLGIRLPAALSSNDRLRTLTLARKRGAALSTRPAIYAWARRTLT
jgi:hypothetical protein